MTGFEWECVNELREALRELLRADWTTSDEEDLAHQRAQSALNGFACSITEPEA